MKEKLGYKIRTITCVACGKQVTDHMRPDQRFCSLECYRSSPKPDRKKGLVRQCGICGVDIYCNGKRITQENIFCSKEHLTEWQGRNKTIHKCKMCNKTFRWSPSRTQSGNYNVTYCSLSCRNADPERMEKLVEMNAMQQRRFQSSIERIGYNLLDDLGIEHLRQHVIGGKFCVDAFIPSHGIVVQFDGDYWHGHPERFPNPDARQRKRMRLDASQDAYMATCGYTVLRFWESELHGDLNLVAAKIQAALVH
jgi:very-short-patch-repair endonuclease